MKYDLPFLISCLCCIPKFQYIFEIMRKLDNEELKTLRDELRKANGRKLNQFLEMEFKNRIGE